MSSSASPSRPTRTQSVADRSSHEEARVVSDVGPFAVVPEWLLVGPEVSDRAVRLYALLALMADRGTREAFPARKTLAQRLGGCSLDSVDRAVDELAAAGAITKYERYRDGRRERSSNLYVVHLAPGDVAARMRLRGGAGAATGSRTGAAPGTRTTLDQSEEARAAVAGVAPDLLDDLEPHQVTAVADAIAENRDGVATAYRTARTKGRDPRALFLHLIATGDHLHTPVAVAASSFKDYD